MKLRQNSANPQKTHTKSIFTIQNDCYKTLQNLYLQSKMAATNPPQNLHLQYMMAATKPIFTIQDGCHRTYIYNTRWLPQNSAKPTFTIQDGCQKTPTKPILSIQDGCHESYVKPQQISCIYNLRWLPQNPPQASHKSYTKPHKTCTSYLFCCFQPNDNILFC